MMWSLKIRSVSRANCPQINRWKHKDSKYAEEYIQQSRIPTFHFQKSLPRLPIPKLEDTCDRYLAAQSPLLQSGHFNKTSEHVNKFRDGVGKQLHETLLKQDKTNKHTSYISKLWFDMYLKDRAPLPINFNPMLVFQNDPKPEYNSQAIRACNMIISSLKFYKSLKDKVLEPEVFHLFPKKSDTNSFRTLCSMAPEIASWYVAYLHNAYPLDMSQYHNLFNTTRVPEMGKDRISFEPAKHVLVQYKGHFYVFNVITESGNIIEPAQIFHSVKQILNEQAESAFPVGVFTTLDRNKWATLRARMIELGNAESLRLIDSALFNVCLDDCVIGDDKYKLVRNFLHADGKNRWFDKSISLQFSKDGYAAINFEHSWGDGVAVLRFFQDILKDSTENPQIHPDSPVPKDTAVRKLDFKLDDSVKGAVSEAVADYQSRCTSLAVNFVESEGIGKKFCKTYGISPDAIMQMCFQAAYHKQFGKFVATYESCSTAAFRHGRTEAIRPCTMATKNYCLALHSSKDRPSKNQLVNLIKECSNVHSRLTKEAAMGQGFDRHLLVLKSIGETEGKNDLEIFNDPAYGAINHNILSTSTLSSPAVLAGGFGPVVRDGYGVGYVIRENAMGTLVTSYPGVDGREFINCFDKSIREVVDILTGSTPE